MFGELLESSRHFLLSRETINELDPVLNEMGARISHPGECNSI